MRKKPTRHDLLVVIGRLQNLVGDARAAYGNDRGSERWANTMKPLDEALDLCIEAASMDPPIRLSGPWAPKTKE